VDEGFFRFPSAAAGIVQDIPPSALLDAPRWRVDREAPLVIEVTDDRGGAVSVAYAIRLADGRFAAADRPGGRVLILGPEGGFQAAWGRKGAGPGQFQSPTWLSQCGSANLHVFDARLRTLTIFNDHGELIDAEQLPPPGDLPAGEQPACDRSGNFAIQYKLERPEAIEEGPFRPMVTLGLRRKMQSAFTDLVSLPGADFYVWPNQVGPLGNFLRRTQFALSEGSVFVMTGDAFEIAEYNLEGGLVRLTRSAGIRRPPVTLKHLEEDRREQLAAVPEEYHAKLTRALDDMQWPAFHPVLEGIIVDDSGCIWVKQGDPDREDTTWRVLTRDGQPIGSLDLPDAFAPTQIKRDEIVGRIRLRGIVVYSLERGANDCGGRDRA
jgi:hypothetical protein